jgi:CRISPR/Cas system-associated exonuclease Cas4 (RecB family)
MIFDPELHLYSDRGRVIPSVTQILKAEGWIDDRFYTEVGRQRGTNFHDASALADENRLDWRSLSVEVATAVETWGRAKAYLGLCITAIEKPLHKGNEWACTPDREAIWRGDPTIVELKTGGQERWHKLQVASAGATFLKEKPQLLLVYINGKRFKVIEIKEEEADYLYSVWHMVQSIHHVRARWKG